MPELSKEDYLGGLAKMLQPQIDAKLISFAQANLYIEQAMGKFETEGTIAPEYYQWSQAVEREDYLKKVEQANFEFVAKQTSTKEYATARQELDKLWDETLKSDMTQGQKQGVLLNAINKVGTKYNFDPVAMENLQRRAVNEVFETLPQREKELQRLRAQYPWQESRYAQRIPSEEMPEYERIFEEQRGQLSGTANFLQIFEREYPNLVRKYQATLPGERQTTAKVEEGWAGYLRNYVSQLKESEARKSPWERGERPSFFAPPIKKVGF